MVGQVGLVVLRTGMMWRGTAGRACCALAWQGLARRGRVRFFKEVNFLKERKCQNGKEQITS